MVIEFVMKIILFVTFIFVIENGLGLGFGGPGTFYDGFKMLWIKQSVTKFEGTSRGVICDAQYMTQFDIVIDIVL